MMEDKKLKDESLKNVVGGLKSNTRTRDTGRTYASTFCSKCHIDMVQYDKDMLGKYYRCPTCGEEKYIPDVV